LSIQYVILGCGYTGRRVAMRLRARGLPVLATSRTPAGLRDLTEAGVTVVRMVWEENDTVEALKEQLWPERRTLYSIPSGMARLQPLLQGRLVYLSTTGVYGKQHVVNELTPAKPETPRELRRWQEEQLASRASNSVLVLRAAAIYGPERGVHASMGAGSYRLIGSGENYVSRIHVDDLAAGAEAGLLGDLTGAWPVADEEPCRAREIAEYCARLLNVPMPPSGEASNEDDTRLADRRVDGAAVRAALGVKLRYPSYRDGIAAALRISTEPPA
jgi:nucleoside-diphosphate-sugar epimerase